MSKKTHIEHLEMLVSFVPPKELRQSVQKALFSYLLEQDEKAMDVNYKKLLKTIFSC